MPEPSSLLCRALVPLLAALAILGGQAQAQDAVPAPRMLGPFELAGELGVVSDYIDRGISSSDNDPAIQGGLTLALPVGEGDTALYFGGWASTVDFDEDGDGPVELEIFTGAYGAFGETGVDWDVWGSYYVYPGARGSLDYDYAELSGRLGLAATEALRLEAGYAFSPDYSGSVGLAHYVDGKVAYGLPLPLPLPVTVEGTLGHQWFESNSQAGLEDYLDWSIGVTTTWRALDMGVRYTDTDLDRRECFGGSNVCDARIVFSFVARF
jgi:uncharacterized protein (TIGR02001 family)